MATEGLNEDFLDVLRCLDDAGVEFLVVGAHALARHGVVRATGDLDIWIRCDLDDAVRAHRALVAFGAPVTSSGLTPEHLAEPGIVYQVGLPPRRIEVLTEISGVSFDTAWPKRVEVEIAGRQVPVLDKQSLLINKRASGRLKDLADVAELESLGDDP